MKIKFTGSFDLAFLGAMLFLVLVSGLVLIRLGATDEVVNDVSVKTTTESTVNNPPLKQTEKGSDRTPLSGETDAEVDIVIQELGVTFTSKLDSPILVTMDEFGNAGLTTQRFVDFVQARDDYSADYIPCEYDIAALAVYADATEAQARSLPFVYDENFDQDGNYIGDGTTIRQLNDGRYASPQRQTQAVCYDTVHLAEASLILQQLDDLRSL
jgi:hypothetical protein